MSDQFRAQLKKYKKKHGIKTPTTKTPNKQQVRKRTEDFSHGDIEELMGINRTTYKRGPGGAIRRK
ncbi:hypothetical protein [Pontibacillus salipaludis]|uniref:Uncharacterized protein n=1 Tax=Pontibacillus salipaludis TaxID=1697394 RepID=A0ABQ1PW91_9BACI|nr:hypothetical protein [Pontibacillus salipaludis]GGD05289.1 hypothetical protein GCM10011389_10990 [Pontibacillus salipaludis]